MYQIVETGRFYPSNSLHEAAIVFEEKRGGGKLCLHIDCRLLNSNIVIDFWPLLRINEIMVIL